MGTVRLDRGTPPHTTCQHVPLLEIYPVPGNGLIYGYVFHQAIHPSKGAPHKNKRSKTFAMTPYFVSGRATRLRKSEKYVINKVADFHQTV